METCTCHISNLTCRNQKCGLLIAARAEFKKQSFGIIYSIMNNLNCIGFSKKECVRALRRENNHKNQMQHDIFDEVAHKIWRNDAKTLK